MSNRGLSQRLPNSLDPQARQSFQRLDSNIESLFDRFVTAQTNFESATCLESRKRNGIFLTHNLSVVDQTLDIINYNKDLFYKTILEPSCGNGIFLLRILYRAHRILCHKDELVHFIENGLFFCDIDPNSLQATQRNLRLLYKHLTGLDYAGRFNAYVLDFTAKPNLFSYSKKEVISLYDMYDKIDYVVGNPPYVTLYGRRDKKQNEQQRAYYLANYRQFPATVKNGKLNYAMLFIEHSLDFLKIGGKLGFVLDTSFFETAYKYTRKYLVENTRILSLTHNMADFDVASGQLVIKLVKEPASDGIIEIRDAKTNRSHYIPQHRWNNEDDEYKFRIPICKQADEIVAKILSNCDKTLKELYPHKNLRTCTMLLDMEDKFVLQHRADRNITSYPYYRGSKSLKEKFGALVTDRYFYYDKSLQDDINDRLKIQLAEMGIKNKKRIGLGEKVIYDNPKIYIRQSAKTLIATYDEQPSAANNSLYVFSLRSDNDQNNNFLRFMCGYLNSDLLTFFAQNRRIIRYSSGKQPQIKISDLYSIPLPDSPDLQSAISHLVYDIYDSAGDLTESIDLLNKLLYEFYGLDQNEIDAIRKSVQAF